MARQPRGHVSRTTDVAYRLTGGSRKLASIIVVSAGRPLPLTMFWPKRSLTRNDAWDCLTGSEGAVLGDDDAGHAGCHDHGRCRESGSRLAAAGDCPRAAELGESEDSQDCRAGMHQCDAAAHVVELVAI